MRILFNHGFTAGELFTNAPENLTKLKWAWINENYGWHRTYEDAIAEPFKYCFSLVINKVLDERVRFKMPVKSSAYIDFEIVSEEKFVEQRQNGRFSEIDFVESDFTGYFLNYFYLSKAYEKMKPIYLGGRLKEKFLSGINSGIKYYTIKDITIKDVIEDVYSKFPDFPKKDIRRIVMFGFKRLHYAIKFGCSISIDSEKYSCLAHIGPLTTKPAEQILKYSLKKDRKLRLMDMWKNEPFDGYYYIGLNESAFDNWVKNNSTSRTITRFENIVVRKVKEELYHRDKHIYVFRFKVKKYKGFFYKIEDIKIKGLEYLGEAIERHFKPSDKSWRELIKEYEREKRSM